MKRTSNSLFNELSNSEMETLTREVKETVFTGYNQNNSNRPFTPADLWSIQRQVRTRTTRRFI
jgi:hypothetical protein